MPQTVAPLQEPPGSKASDRGAEQPIVVLLQDPGSPSDAAPQGLAEVFADEMSWFNVNNLSPSSLTQSPHQMQVCIYPRTQQSGYSKAWADLKALQLPVVFPGFALSGGPSPKTAYQPRGMVSDISTMRLCGTPTEQLQILLG